MWLKRETGQGVASGGDAAGRGPGSSLFTGRITLHSAVAAAMVILAGLASLAWHHHVPLLPDVRDKPLLHIWSWDMQSYLHMAQQNYTDVVSPFSKRWLYPLLARTLEGTLHLGWPASFLALNLLAFGLLAWCLAASLEVLLGKPWLALALLLTPFPLESLQLAYLPDLFHAALTALFFLLLLKDKILWALVVLFVAFAVRESTLLLCLVCAAAAWLHRRRSLCVGSLLVLVAGSLLAGWFARLGQPNVHRMPELLYLGLKVPYNFLLNYLGIVIWTDVNQTGNPLVTWAVPAFLHVTDKRIGIGFDWRFPAITAIALLSTFGTGPAVLARFARRWRELLRGPTPLPIQLALGYGVLCFLIGPALGSWTERLVGYGWPAFWLGLPFLLHSVGLRPGRRECFWLISGYVLVCWLPRLVGFSRSQHYLPCLLLAIPYLMTWAWLRKQSPPAAVSQAQTPDQPQQPSPARP